ncbi:glycoside hydrolase family 5 protein, partial [Aureobasidium melanogenum]
MFSSAFTLSLLASSTLLVQGLPCDTSGSVSRRDSETTTPSISRRGSEVETAISRRGSEIETISRRGSEVESTISRRNSEVETTISRRNSEATLESRQACDVEDTDPIRGVNLGGWFVLEPWMNWELVGDTGAVDQWTFDQTDGAEAKLQDHWGSWFTESDMAQIAAWGLNTVRIPIGYWAFNNTDSPYISGADAYLEQALGWARQYNIQALICMHGLPGSQNGFDNSGHKGEAQWAENSTNLAASTAVLELMAAKYGVEAYADVVYGLELANEPIVWDETSARSAQEWAVSTVQAMRTHITNPDLKLIMHDAFLGAKAWETVAEQFNFNADSMNFVLDVHLYQNQGGDTSNMNQDQHIATVCDYPNTQFVPASANLPVVVGEFSDQTNICVDASGNVTAGTSCSTDGCQCSAQLDPSEWNADLVAATRKFMEAQLDIFEEYSEGWFLWSYTGPGAWGMGNLFNAGVIGPDHITQRQYPAQCNSTSSS